MVEKKRYLVHIYEKEYAILSDDSQEHVLEAAQCVNELMSSIMNKSALAEFEKVAILVALRLASDALKLKIQAQETNKRHEHLVSTITQEIMP